MARIKEKIIREVERLPEDKISEIYDLIHLRRVMKKVLDKYGKYPSEVK